MLGNGPHLLGNGLHVLGNEKVEYKINTVPVLILGRLGWVSCFSWPYLVR